MGEWAAPQREELIMERRRLMMKEIGGGSVLPPEYQQIEWLGVSNGTVKAYIDTGIIPYIGLNFETKFAQTTYPFSSQKVDSFSFGADIDWSDS